MSRRLLIAGVLGLLLFSTPALAGLSITDRQQASTSLATGPQFYAFETGTDLSVGSATGWAGFALEGLEVDTVSGSLTLGRAGDVAPSAIPWHDDASTTRACESGPASSVRSMVFDARREIEAGRLEENLADIRVFAVAEGPVADAAAVPFRLGSPSSTSVVVDTTSFAEPTAVCVYWGNPEAGSLSDPTLRGPVDPDGGWSWQVWENAGDGLSLDIVDWSSPSTSGAVATASAPTDACNQCANELVGFVTPPVSGSYRFYLSANDVGRLELAPLDDPAALSPVVELVDATPAGDFSDPAQASVLVELTAGQPYAIRARSKDLIGGDHLQIGWAIDGEAPAILPAEILSDVAGTARTLTHRRFDLVDTADRSGEPTTTSRIEASEKPPDSGDYVANAISGYVVIPETATFRFWISSDDEGALRLATNGNPAAASRVAWLTDFTSPDTWTSDPSQRSAAYELTAGQVIWLSAHNRDGNGPDHLQVGWSRDDSDAAPDLIPVDALSEAPPAEAPLPSADLGEIEGQQSSTGTFVSDPIDATPGGSNVFGLFSNVSSGAVEADVSFSNDPTGPWTAPIPLIDDLPAPLAADGLRYLRISGSMETNDGVVPTASAFGVRRDLNEAVSTDADTTISLTGAGDQLVLRVKGSIGEAGDAQITGNTGAVAFTFATDADAGRDELPFGNGAGHHVIVSAVPGVDAATARWSVQDPGGAVVVHDVTVLFD